MKDTTAIEAFSVIEANVIENKLIENNYKYTKIISTDSSFPVFQDTQPTCIFMIEGDVNKKDL